MSKILKQCSILYIPLPYQISTKWRKQIVLNSKQFANFLGSVLSKMAWHKGKIDLLQKPLLYVCLQLFLSIEAHYYMYFSLINWLVIHYKCSLPISSYFPKHMILNIWDYLCYIHEALHHNVLYLGMLLSPIVSIFLDISIIFLLFSLVVTVMIFISAWFPNICLDFIWII